MNGEKEISMITSDTTDVDDELFDAITPCRSAFYAVKGIRVESRLSEYNWTLGIC